MNFVFISPNFPHTYWQFCDRLKRNGVNVLGIGDTPYDALEAPLKASLTEYYRVSSMEDYDQMYRAVAFFAFKYGKIDWLESNNEYWLEQDARLRTDFHITTGIQEDEIGAWKHKSSMKPVYAAAGIPTARCHKVTDKEAAETFLKRIGGFPVIAKPDVGVGAANTYKIENEAQFEAFFAEKPDVPYVMEEFVTGDICSYDAITDSHCEPVFESMTVWPPSIADIVNLDLDLSYYTCAEVPEALKDLGRRALKGFNVRSRFVHLEFFRLTKARKGLGEIGDFVALEVNMRPAGGYTPDMMNFAHATDVYQIWADMVTKDERILADREEDHWCVYASRKDWHTFKHTHEEILARYGERIVMCERMPELMWATMGCQMYTAHAYSEEEVQEFIAFVHERA
ncbi:MAG: carbamoylphosphate synthase large subunit [Lachnospiraceae bacterium]|nr:carbamoylphosphate synthase large subunit [Lachnospiraceae bacterium]